MFGNKKHSYSIEVETSPEKLCSAYEIKERENEKVSHRIWALAKVQPQTAVA